MQLYYIYNIIECQLIAKISQLGHNTGMKALALKEKYLPLLKQIGLKATPERLYILDALNKTKKPLSVKDLKEDLKNVDQATIYRTMEVFVKNDVVSPVNLQHDHNHYELVRSDHHHHAICEKCGKVVDISKCDINTLEKQVKKVAAFKQINTHALEFFGICQACAKKK